MLMQTSLLIYLSAAVMHQTRRLLCSYSYIMASRHGPFLLYFFSHNRYLEVWYFYCCQIIFELNDSEVTGNNRLHDAHVTSLQWTWRSKGNGSWTSSCIKSKHTRDFETMIGNRFTGLYKFYSQSNHTLFPDWLMEILASLWEAKYAK